MAPINLKSIFNWDSNNLIIEKVQELGLIPKSGELPCKKLLVETKLLCNLNEEAVKAAVKENVRFNGRSLREFRECEVNFGKSSGFCEVVFQPFTRVLAQVSARIGDPNDSRPGEGVLQFSVWISPASNGEMAGGGSQRSSIIARTLERIFKENRAIDLESLCVKFGEKVWVIRVDVHVIETNGCLAEAATLAVLGAFITFDLPNAAIEEDEDGNEKVLIDNSNTRKLYMFHLPSITSFLITEHNSFIAEPDREEEEIYPGKLMVGLNESKEYCYLHLTNPLERPVLSRALAIAKEKCLERIKMMKSLAEEQNQKKQVPLYLLQQSDEKELGVKIRLADLRKIPKKNDPREIPPITDIKLES